MLCVTAKTRHSQTNKIFWINTFFFLQPPENSNWETLDQIWPTDMFMCFCSYMFQTNKLGPTFYTLESLCNNPEFWLLFKNCYALGHSIVSDSLWPFGLQTTKLLCPWDFSVKNTGVGCHFPPPGDLSNPGMESTSPVSPPLQADSLPTEPSGKIGRCGKRQQLEPGQMARKSVLSSN